MREQLPANSGVIARRQAWLCPVYQRTQKVSTGDHAHHLLSIHHRHALDMILFHDGDDLVKRCVFGDGMDLGGHNFAHLACARMDVFICQLARTDKQFDPTGTPTQGVCFRPTQEIAFANDTSQPP
jgi:hypothetical protein